MAATEQEVTEFVHKALGDVGAALTAALVVVGDKVGLYKALAGSGGLTPADLAARTMTSERYVREWCSAQAAAGYLTYEPASGRFSLPDAHAVALTDEESPACVLGGFQGMTASRPDKRVRELICLADAAARKVGRRAQAFVAAHDDGREAARGSRDQADARGIKGGVQGGKTLCEAVEAETRFVDQPIGQNL